MNEINKTLSQMLDRLTNVPEGTITITALQVVRLSPQIVRWAEVNCITMHQLEHNGPVVLSIKKH